MGPTSLVSDRIDAGTRFLAELGKLLDIKSAFWLKVSGEDNWSLYVASDQINDDNFDVFYGDVLRIAQQNVPPFDSFQVKLISADDPLAQAVDDIQRLHPGSLDSRLRGKVINFVPIEDAYLYPTPLPIPTA